MHFPLHPLLTACASPDGKSNNQCRLQCCYRTALLEYKTNTALIHFLSIKPSRSITCSLSTSFADVKAGILLCIYKKNTSFLGNCICPLFTDSKAFPFTPTIADKWLPESSKGCKKVQKRMLRVRRPDIFPGKKTSKNIQNARYCSCFYPQDAVQCKRKGDRVGGSTVLDQLT